MKVTVFFKKNNNNRVKLLSIEIPPPLKTLETETDSFTNTTKILTLLDDDFF